MSTGRASRLPPLGVSSFEPVPAGVDAAGNSSEMLNGSDAGVGMIEGTKQITPEMLRSQRLRALKAQLDLQLMEDLYNNQPENNQAQDSALVPTQRIWSDNHSGSTGGPILESTSPPPASPGCVNESRRTASQHEPRIMLDDQDTARQQVGGGSPSTKPQSNTDSHTPIPPPRDLRDVPGVARSLASARARMLLVARVLAVLHIERGRVVDGCPVCGANHVPGSVLDLLRFMCSTWREVDEWVYKNGTGEQLMSYPVIQGTSAQIKLQRIGDQKYDHKKLREAIDWMITHGNGDQVCGR